MPTTSYILFKHLATNEGSVIKDTPKLLLVTLGEGHPQFKLISSYPIFSTKTAALANDSGLQPPN